ncbi:hypothetical protein [Hydrogenophaga palleronii]|uniref:hypothetical protein n=1 Tax=Hydrogenophaga palleronii TaxID=65655 RepID=UPI000B0435DC|nr:hypothetical protein [Hydrogenophaga palleronii]
MDINEKIAQRRREMEAQRIVDAPIEQAIIQREVQRNLEAHGHKPTEQPEHLQRAIAAETEKALDALAVKQFTKGDWFEVGSLVVGGALVVFAVWWIGLALMAWGIYLFNKKTRFYVHHMKVQAEKIRAAQETPD